MARAGLPAQRAVPPRAQYLAFLGRSHPELARRFVRRCGAAAVEETWNGTQWRLCRIGSRRLYRTLGAEHVRHRREATPEVALRRLLSLDYVLDHLGEPWLPTETEKVAALTAAGVPRHVLPGRLYVGADSSRRRHFVHKLPVALDNRRATFVFVQAEDATEAGVRTWGAQHAGVWAALGAAGRAVEIVVVGRDPVPLDAAGRVLDGWVRAPRTAGTETDADAELETIRQAVTAGDLAKLDRWGGLNGALARMRELARTAGAGRAAPAVASGRTWRSRRVPE